MIATESDSIPSENHRHLWFYHTVFSSNRLGQRRFGPFRASQGLDSGLPEINQPLPVVAGRHHHHHHRKVRPRVTDGAQQLAAHLIDDSEHLLDLRTRLGDAFVAQLLAVKQWRVPMALPLDRVAKAVFLRRDPIPELKIAPKPRQALVRPRLNLDKSVCTRQHVIDHHNQQLDQVVPAWRGSVIDTNTSARRCLPSIAVSRPTKQRNYNNQGL